MANLSTYLQNALLNAVLRNTTYTSPGTVWVALYTSNPTAGDTGTEVSGGTYARASITFNAPSGGAVTNTADVNITGMPAVTVTHIGIRNASTGGNLLFFGAVGAPKTTNVNDTYTIRAGDLTLALS
jgi:hypothetical protein